MKNAGYEGPPNGDYVAYVDKLLRSSPEYRRTQHNIGNAVQRAQHSPGSAGEASISELKAKFERIKQQALAAQASLGDPLGSHVGGGLPGTHTAERESLSTSKKMNVQRRVQAAARDTASSATVKKTASSSDNSFLSQKGGSLGWFLIVVGVVMAQGSMVFGWTLILLGVLVYFLRIVKKLGGG